jgi:hypothetical protein
VTTTVSTPGAVSAPIAPAAVARSPLRGLVERYDMRRDAPHRWLLVAATSNLEHEGGIGARASIDLLEYRHLDLGIAGSLTPSRSQDRHEHGRGGFESRGGAEGGLEGSAVAYIAVTGSLGGLDVRAQIGLGFGSSGGMSERRGRGERRDEFAIARSTVGKPTPVEPPEGDGAENASFAPRAEAALLIALPLGRHLGLVGGPVITATSLDHAMNDRGHEPQVDVTLEAGLRYRF